MSTIKAAGVKAVSVTYGFRSREELEKAGGTVFVSDPSLLGNLDILV